MQDKRNMWKTTIRSHLTKLYYIKEMLRLITNSI